MNTVFDDVWKKDKECDSWTLEVCRNGIPKVVTVTKERFALLEPHQVGIGFRMLQPHELAAAQSFPKGYKFMGTKSEVVKQIGNSVCPKIAESLVGAGLAK